MPKSKRGQQVLPAVGFKQREPTEAEVRESVESFMELHRWLIVRHKEGPFSEKGIPDISIWRRGIHCYVEFKRPSGKQSQPQIDFEASVTACGARYIVVRCVEDFLVWEKNMAALRFPGG